MGAKIGHGAELTVGPTGGRLRGCSIDMNETPDALPAMAVAAALAEGETRLLNVPQARVKETDRIAVMASELGKWGRYRGAAGRHDHPGRPASWR